MRIMTEACGSLVSAYLLKAIKEAGHQAIGSDISPINAAFCLADEYITVPDKDDSTLWSTLEQLLIDKQIDAVIPSLDETLLGWAERIEYFRALGIEVLLSPARTIAMCQDKWETYLFFTANNIPCPQTALDQNFPLVKPRLGRGSSGVAIVQDPIDMNGKISQEVVQGQEFTVDTFFDRNGHPVYIVPRKRLNIQNGKSTRGIVCRHAGIEDYILQIAQATLFLGPVNFQCFVNEENISFIEINPRIAGGMALGFAATENWVNLMITNILGGQPIIAKPIQNGLKMYRYYAECFIS